MPLCVPCYLILTYLYIIYLWRQRQESNTGFYFKPFNLIDSIFLHLNDYTVMKRLWY